MLDGTMKLKKTTNNVLNSKSYQDPAFNANADSGIPYYSIIYNENGNIWR